jgi:major vault protein repeat-containing protein
MQLFPAITYFGRENEVLVRTEHSEETMATSAAPTATKLTGLAVYLGFTAMGLLPPAGATHSSLLRGYSCCYYATTTPAVPSPHCPHSYSHGECEVRLHSPEPFPLYPGEMVKGKPGLFLFTITTGYYLFIPDISFNVVPLFWEV